MSDLFNRTFLKTMFSNVLHLIQTQQHGGMKYRLLIVAVIGVLVILAIFCASKSLMSLGRAIETVWLIAFSPSDLYCPYFVQGVQDTPSQYHFFFKHRYMGKQEVMLNVINNKPGKFDYNNPDMLNLEFIGIISDDNQEVRKEFMKKFISYYLTQGTNSIPIYQYEIWLDRLIKARYSLEIEIRGDLKAFIERYPGSFLSVRNGTVK